MHIQWDIYCTPSMLLDLQIAPEEGSLYYWTLPRPGAEATAT
jgi:hypothetical protein